MKNRLFIGLPLCAALLLGSSSAFAQDAVPSKAETKLYNSTMKKPSMKAYDKFLQKYPDSSYAPEIASLRKAVIDEGAEAAVAGLMDGKSEDNAALLRHTTDDADSVIYLELDADSGRNIHVRIFSLDTRKYVWSCTFEADLAKDVLDPAMDRSFFVNRPELTPVNDNMMIEFSYLNSSSSDAAPLEYVHALLSPDGQNLTSSIFYGNNLLKEAAAASAAFSIEGRSPDALSQGGLSKEQIYLMEKLSSNTSLVTLSKADELTDESIRWWLEKNPAAQTTAKSLRFGNIPEESSLVEGYRKASKENGSSYSAAKFDIRGYTVIVSYSKQNKEYSIVWAEPVCQNKNTDAYLNSIYFSGSTSNLNLFYYKGKKTYKYYINLANKSIQR